MNTTYETVGLAVPQILLPAKDIDLHSWSVIAVDQYTSQPKYWQQVALHTDNNPSTLHLVLPEVYLNPQGNDKEINQINQNMNTYLSAGILRKTSPGFVLIDRSTPINPSRKGLLVALDLEQYNFSATSQSLIRATEGTVLDRLPPRVKIRQDAPLEVPHILILIDDPQKTVIEPLFAKTADFEKIYDFDLMQGGGHITGWHIQQPSVLDAVANALAHLAERDLFQKKYNADKNKGTLLYAAGDGNHSLASAKTHWENIKQTTKASDLATHPARYALVELVNIHDEGVIFEPIHRVVFNVDTDEFLADIAKEGVKVLHFDDVEALQKEKKRLEDSIKTLSENAPAMQFIPFLTHTDHGMLVFRTPTHTLPVGSLQKLLDKLVKKYNNMEIDYIHGKDVVSELASKKDNIGFYLPPMNKNDLFKTIIHDGPLPRKTFSMGEAEEKRYYLESRIIKPLS